VALTAPTRESPDTLVVCPAEFQPALAEWESHRRGQGHEILVVRPPTTADQLKATISDVAASGRLKYVVLIGDVAPRGQVSTSSARVEPATKFASSSNVLTTAVPINYELAKINIRWGYEPTIATDIPYADVDGDGLPDLAIGRIPADSAKELNAVMRKVLHYERETSSGNWDRRLNIIAGTGGFGHVADAIIEAAGRQVIQQAVPAGYDIRHTFTRSANTKGQRLDAFAENIRKQLCEDSFAWIYLGHGLPGELAPVPTPHGPEPLLTVRDVSRIRCGVHSPLAVLIACYTGAMDAPRDCLAEELLLSDRGPLAVIAATRVTMPYGNTVFGHELLRACFVEPAPTLGDILRVAERNTLKPPGGEQLRESLDSMAVGLSPPPVDLAAERREHVLMYHLYGDPLLRLRRGDTPSVAKSSTPDAVVK
jgi:hypothetical protein